MSRMFKQSKRLLRYSYSSLIVVFLDRQGLIHSNKIYIPQREWNFYCALAELLSRVTRISLETNLLSSITLCFTMQFGIILLAKQSSILVSSCRFSILFYQSSMRAYIIFNILRPIQYYSTLYSYFNLNKIYTKDSKSPFYIIHIFKRQQTSKISSSVGYSEMISSKNYTQRMLISIFGWLSILSTGVNTFDSRSMGSASWVMVCNLQRMLSISSSVGQNLSGSVEYFILRLRLFSYSSSRV